MLSPVEWMRTYGATPELDAVERRHLAILNLCVSVVMFVTITSMFGIGFDPVQIAANTVMMGLQLIVLLLIGRGQRQAARVIFAFSGLYISGALGLIFGPESLAEVIPVAVIVGSFAYFSPRERMSQGVMVALAAVTCVVLHVVFDVVQPAPRVPEAARMSGYITVVSTVAICAAFAYLGFSSYERSERELAAERARSEALLRNILPDEIAQRLRASPGSISDRHEAVTILFADLVGFTPLAAQRSPGEVVAVLDGLFRTFDNLCERHGLEKIKTIGDAYMAAAGVPRPRDDHAEAAVALALDMLDAVARDHAHDKLALRVGIASGPVIAGVIGERKFSYDLWGNAVNTASRMESHGIAGRIQIDATTRERLAGRVSLEERGVIDVKGLGPTTVWLVSARSA